MDLQIVFCYLPTLSTFFRFVVLRGSAMGVVWNMYKGLKVWFKGGACTLKELQLMIEEHNLQP
jgi:hypothetical protein